MSSNNSQNQPDQQVNNNNQNLFQKGFSKVKQVASFLFDNEKKNPLRILGEVALFALINSRISKSMDKNLLKIVDLKSLLRNSESGAASQTQNLIRSITNKNRALSLLYYSGLAFLTYQTYTLLRYSQFKASYTDVSENGKSEFKYEYKWTLENK